jgi:hypothetical protein
MLGDEALELEIAILQYGEVRRKLAKGFIARGSAHRGCFFWPISGAVDLVFSASDLTGILGCFY